MRYAVPALFVALSFGAVACDGESAAKTDPAAPAGDVVELTGSATATRHGATRDLTLGAEVYGDDVIETGAESSIAIMLSHNRARVTWAANVKQRLDESTAWRAEPAEGGDLAARDENRTGAAGRHTEREAAQTARSDVPKTESERERGDDGDSPVAATVVSETPPESTQSPTPTPNDKRDPKTKGTNRKTGKRNRSGSGGGENDVRDGFLGTGSGVSGKDGEPDDNKAPSDKPPAPIATLKVAAATGGLSKDAAGRTVAGAGIAVKKCAEQAGGTGTATVTLAVGTDGRVKRARVSGAGGSKFRSCARAALLKPKFGAAGEPTTVVVEIVLSKIE